MSVNTGRAVLLCSAAIYVGGCVSAAKPSPMDRCRGGRVMTVTDRAGDGLRGPRVVPDQNLAVTHNRAAFDVRRVRIAVTRTMLCAAITFAGGDPELDESNDTTLRVIQLELANPKIRPDGGLVISHLEFGTSNNAVGWAPADTLSAEVNVRNATTNSVRGSHVEIAAPLRPLTVVSGPGRASIQRRFDPRSFAWRLSVASDCSPGPTQMFVFPTRRRITFPADGHSPDRAMYCR